MGGTVNGDIYTRYRQAVEQLGQGMTRWRAMGVAANAMTPEVAPAPAAERWRSAGVQFNDQVSRQLLETQAAAEETDAGDDVDPAMEDLGEVDPGAEDPGEVDPDAPDGSGDTGAGDSMTPTPMPAPTPTPTTPPVSVDPPMTPMPTPVIDPTPDVPVQPTPTPSPEPKPVSPEPMPVPAPTPVVVAPPVPQPPVLQPPVLQPPVVLPPPPPAATPALEALSAIVKARNAAVDPVAQSKRQLFSGIDTDRDGVIGANELTAAVTKGGGTAAEADALRAKLDPAGSGTVTMQQFSDNLPSPWFQQLDFESGTMMSMPGNTANEAVAALYSSGVGTTQVERPAAQTSSAGPLSPFDIDRNGSLQLHELMVAVQRGGGTAQMAQSVASYADPNGTGVTLDLLARLSMQANPLFETESYIAPIDMNAQAGLQALFTAVAAENTPERTAARELFSGLDGNADGTVNANDVMNAVTSAGGSRDDASALYQQLDPQNTGGITMEQFVANLPPIDLNTNGMMSVRASAPVQPTPADPTGAQTGIPLPMSSDVMSVLLGLQTSGSPS